jgi:hypothetical protein
MTHEKNEADDTTPHFYICNPLRFFDEVAIHGGSTRNVAYVGRARRGRGDHLDLYREYIRPLSFLLLSMACFRHIYPDFRYRG